jgi:protein-L-isoaspartate O-methyltransferase
MIEYVPELAERAGSCSAICRTSASSPATHTTLVVGGAQKVHCGFSIAELPAPWAEALVEGGILVAPVGDARRQVLTVFEKRGGVMIARPVMSVLYVGDRSRANATHCMVVPTST